ncbi:SPOSA6832_00398, partial [Sporobolomyces salmonicolor]
MGVDLPPQQPPVVTAEAEIATAPTALTDPTPSGSGTTALEASNLDPNLPQELVYAVTCKWKGAGYELKIAEHDTAVLWSLTGVPPERMKLVGLVKGKLPGDEEEVVKLGLGDTAPGKRKEFMMIGTPEGEEHKAVGPSAKDEADIDYAATEALKKAQQAAQSVRNRRKLKEAADALQIDQMAAPRLGKKLLGEFGLGARQVDLSCANGLLLLPNPTMTLCPTYLLSFERQSSTSTAVSSTRLCGKSRTSRRSQSRPISCAFLTRNQAELTRSSVQNVHAPLSSRLPPPHLPLLRRRDLEPDVVAVVRAEASRARRHRPVEAGRLPYRHYAFP